MKTDKLKKFLESDGLNYLLMWIVGIAAIIWLSTARCNGQDTTMVFAQTVQKEKLTLYSRPKEEVRQKVAEIKYKQENVMIIGGGVLFVTLIVILTKDIH